MVVRGLTIVSGGQTGVDRAALDAALAAGVPCSGWCPAGRRAEDGPIPRRYPLRELANAAYAERTAWNVRDSDGTVVFYEKCPKGGTAWTLRCCLSLGRPYRLLDAARMPPPRAARALRGFIIGNGIRRLNVAGPRASQAPALYRYARRTLAELLGDNPPSPNF